MSRKAVFDEERCEVKDEEEKLATLKLKIITIKCHHLITLTVSSPSQTAESRT